MSANTNTPTRGLRHVLKAEAARPDATDRERPANASPGGGPVGMEQPAAAGLSGFDFTGLTAPQRGVLAMQGWQPGSGQQPRPRTVAKLVERGLVVERDIVFCGVAMKAYEVPMDVHAAFCEWCSKQERAA